MNINDFHDDCLLLILKQFPLQELVHLRSVCVRWHSLINEFCSRKHTLKLFGSFDSIYRYSNDLVSLCREADPALMLKPAGKDDDLIVNFSDLDLFDFLANTFPNIQHLVVHLNKAAYILLPVLLDAWKSTLISLAISGDLPGDPEFQEQLFSSINSMQNLKRLEIFNELVFGQADHVFSCAFPIPDVARQLETLSLIGCAGNILDLLVQLGPSLKKLTLDRIALEQLQALLEIKPEFGNHLTHLSVDDLDEGGLYFICAHFPALESLELGLDVKIFDIANHIRQLTRLQALSFKTFGVDQLEGQEQDDLQALPRLASIRKLHIYRLNIFALSKTGPNLLCKTFATVFPNVEKINIRQDSIMLPAVLAGIHPEGLSIGELHYLDRYWIYSSSHMDHAGRHAARCRDEKQKRKSKMYAGLNLGLRYNVL